MAIRGTPLLLVLSLAANAALLTIIEIRDPEILHIEGLGATSRVQPVVVVRPVAATSSPGPLGAGATELMFKGDAKTIYARLLAAGFPRSVIRAIVTLKVDEPFHEREKAIAERLKPKPYWKARPSDFDQSALADMQAVNRERNKQINAIMGPDNYDMNVFGQVFVESMHGGLSAEAYSRMDAIQSDYDDMKKRVIAAANGILMPEDNEKLAYLDKEREADLAAAMSPDDLLTYQLHNSPAASTLRANLVAFNPTEDEFKAIYKAQQDVNTQLGAPDGSLTADQQQARQASLLAALQQVLSPDRFADYKTDTDPAYAGVDRLVQQLNLPPDTTQQVVAMQSDYTQQVAAINGNSQISPADKITELSALADEATAKLTAALGARGFYAYQQSSGSWLQQLKAKGK
jgi:hypothetical protein